MDFTFPFSFDVARLYSVEFLSGVTKVLKSDGIFVHSTPFPFSYGDHYNLEYYDRLLSSTYKNSGLKKPFNVHGSAKYIHRSFNNQ